MTFLAGVRKVSCYDIEYKLVFDEGVFGTQLVQRQGNELIMKAQVFPLTSDFATAGEIVHMLLENEVFPASLHDVVEDFEFEKTGI